MFQGPCREAQNGYVSDKKAINHYASFKHRFDGLFIREGSSDKKAINHDRTCSAPDFLRRGLRIIWLQISLR